jgi:hypothetical protein
LRHPPGVVDKFVAVNGVAIGHGIFLSKGREISVGEYGEAGLGSVQLAAQMWAWYNPSWRKWPVRTVVRRRPLARFPPKYASCRDLLSGRIVPCRVCNPNRAAAKS